MSLNYEKLVRHFSGDFAGIAENVLSRIDADEIEKDAYEAVLQAMDDELIYTEDQWAMIEYYCTPQNADFNGAWEDFANDLMSAINDGVLVREEKGDQYIGTLGVDAGNYYEVIKRDGKLLAGSATNTGLIVDFSIDYDDDETLDGNLERLYETISEAYQD